MSTQRVVGIVVGSVGVVGIGVGSFFGLRAKAKKDDSLDNGHCPNNPNVCDQTGTDLRNQARTSATIATVSMIAGGAALAGGIVLFLTAPHAHAEGARVSSLRVTAQSDGVSSARVSLGGNF
jgi:serine/threonine-protein kinase